MSSLIGMNSGLFSLTAQISDIEPVNEYFYGEWASFGNGVSLMRCILHVTWGYPLKTFLHSVKPVVKAVVNCFNQTSPNIGNLKE